MTQFKSDFLRTLAERGFIHQTSDDTGLDELFATETVSAYIGFDPTASSLHVGSLIQIMMLHWLEKTGHRAVALMGGGTGMVGDPSFKDEARKLMTTDTIGANIEGIKQVFSNYLSFGSGPKDALMLNNAEWLMPLNYLEFLRDVGQHFSINRMLSFDSVKQRLDREQSLSFLEFNYMILQAYDFVELNRRYGVRLQMGGSDQKAAFGLTTPLLTTASGAKMGKSLNGAIWLNADLLSAYDFWQYWRNTEDADVERFLKLYTTLPLDEIARIVAGDINEAKKRLATEVTGMIRGIEAAQEAAETARATFETGAIDLSLPTATVTHAELAGGIGILAALVTAGLAGSNGEARRHIQSGAVRVNDAVIDDDKLAIGDNALLDEGVIKLSVGKKRHALLKPV